MADSILQAYGAASLDPVGTGDVPPAGTSVDATAVGVSSRDGGAAFIVGDPGLAASPDSGAAGAPATPLPLVRSSSSVAEPAGSAVQVSGSAATVGSALGIAGMLDIDGIAPAGATAATGDRVTAGGSAVQFSGPVVGGGSTADSADGTGPTGADTPVLGGGGIAPAGTAASSGDPVTAAGLAGGAVEGVVAGGGSTSVVSSGHLSGAAAFISTGSGGGDVWAVTGSGGLTFDVSFDQSAGVLPTGFENGVLSAFQYYADTFKGSGITLYFNVGYGELDGSSIASGDLGESFTFFGAQQTYSTLSSTMSARATTAADKAAIANDLPATDPTGGKLLDISKAQAKALGLLAGTAGSFAHPDGDIGFSSTDSFDYTSGQTPASGTYYFLAVVEHEISEVMGVTPGCVSIVNTR